MQVPRILIKAGWNQRPLTYADFERLCDETGVLIQRVAMRTPGMYFECRGRPIISLSNKLQGVRLWYAAFHELTHHLLHPPGLRCFSPRSVSKSEAEAETLGICSVLDEPTFYRILAEGELHDFPKDMLKKRMEVCERLQI